MGLFNFNKEPAFVKDLKGGNNLELVPSIGPYVITSMGIRNHGTVQLLHHSNKLLSIRINVIDLNEIMTFDFNFDNKNEVFSPEPDVFAWEGCVDHCKARLAYVKSSRQDMLIIDCEQPSFFSTIVVPIQKYR